MTGFGFVPGAVIDAGAYPCQCGGPAHRRLWVTVNSHTVLLMCEWVLWLMRQCQRGESVDLAFEALVERGLEPTEPDPQWRAALAAMED